MLTTPRYKASQRDDGQWGIFCSFTQTWALDEKTDLGIARWGDRRVAEAEAARLNQAYEKAIMA